MIKTVTITNHQGDSITLTLARPELSGLAVKSIEGLGPSKATINMTQMGSYDGSLFNSAASPSRNIIFNLEFVKFYGQVEGWPYTYGNPEWRIEESRILTYKYFPIKKRIRIQIESLYTESVVNDNRILCDTYGYVESNEPNIFSKNEGTTISVICPDPYFYSTTTDVTTFSGTLALFQFPFSNPHTTTKLIQMGELTKFTQLAIRNDGDAAIGMTIFMYAQNVVSGEIMIANLLTRELMYLYTSKLRDIVGPIDGVDTDDLVFGDEIIISTIKGNKFAILQRAGNYYNIINALNRDADWFQLEQGNNQMGYMATNGYLDLDFRIETRPAYEGV